MPYAKDVVMADFDAPGDDDVFDKVRPDLAAKSITLDDDLLKKHLESVPGRSAAADQGRIAMTGRGRTIFEHEGSVKRRIDPEATGKRTSPKLIARPPKGCRCLAGRGRRNRRPEGTGADAIR